MNETNKKPVKDAAKKRREYLRDVNKCDFLGALGVIVAFFFGLPTVVGAVSFMDFIASPEAAGSWYSTIYVIGLLLSSWLTYLGMRHYFRWEEKSKSIPYVPPVAEQITALPAEEILLRGSDQPAAAHGELLRATHSATEKAPDELLRTTENGTT